MNQSGSVNKLEPEQEQLLVAKWLFDRKYYDSLVAFESDAGIHLHEATSQIKLIKKICLDGDFDGLKILMDKMFTDPHLTLFKFSITRHELLERLSCIKTRNDVQRFVCDLEASKTIIGSELVSQIESALSMPDPLRHEIYHGWSKIKGRYELFEAMLPVLRRIFPDQSYTARLSDSCPTNPLEMIVSRFRKNNPAEFDSFFHGPKFSTPIESPAPIAVHLSPVIVPPKPPSPPPALSQPTQLPPTLPSCFELQPAHRYKDSSNSPVRVACFSSDGTRLAIGTNSQSLVLCDIRPGVPDLSVSRRIDKLHAGSVYSIAWSSNLIATGSNDQTIKLTPDDSSTRPGARIKLESGTVRGLDFQTNSQFLFAGCSGDSIVRQLDPIKGTMVAKFPTCPSSLNDTSFINTVSSTNDVIVCALSNGAVVAVDTRCTSAVWRIGGSNNTSAVANCHGHYVAVGTESGNVGLFDMRSTGDPVWYIKNGHQGACRSVSLSHTSDPIIASGSFDKKIKLWKSGKTVSTLEGQHTDRIVHVQWSKLHDSLVSCSTDSSVFVWKQ